MARPRKLNSEEMLRIVDAFYEHTGDTSRMKFSLIEEYAVSLGFDVKAYDFRRDSLVRQRIDELKNATNPQSIAVAYKSMDVDALLQRNYTKESLKTGIMELDTYWRSIYEAAAALTEKNKSLMTETLLQKTTIKQLSNDNYALTAQSKDNERRVNALVLENRHLKSTIKKYLYPAIANEILKSEGSLEHIETTVMPLAMDELVEAATPASFSQSTVNDQQMLSREESLIMRMRRKTHGYQKTTPKDNN